MRVDSDYVHVSSMIGWCPRQVALLMKRSQSVPMSVRSEMRLLWAIGRAVEKHIRDGIIEHIGRDKAFGNWTCQCGATSFVGFGKFLPSYCRKCSGSVTCYTEYQVKSDDYRVRGSIDLLVAPHGELVPVEIKSITNSPSANSKKVGFDSLKQALGDHQHQAGIYGYLLRHEKVAEEYGVKPSDSFVVLYGSKDYRFGKPYKEFHVPIAAREKPAVTDLKLAKQAWRASKNLSPLPMRVCSTIECTRAKECPVALECFQGKIK